MKPDSCVVRSGRSVNAALRRQSSLQENRSGTDLHEHAEARLQQVGEAAGHVLDVGTLRSVRVEDLLQDLPQEGTIGGLRDKKHRATRQHPQTPANTRKHRRTPANTGKHRQRC